MELGTLIVVGLVIIVALIFDFTNGFHDTANAMATSIATGALKPKTAVAAAGILNLIGAFLSVEVAKTISGGLINEDVVTIAPEFILAGLIGAILWNLLTWLVGLPSSSSHALFGGLVGAVIVGAGVAGVNFGAVVTKIILPSVISVIVAGLAAYTATKLIALITKGMNPEKIESGFRHGQTVTACLVALSHGTNDAQKTMGIITLTLVAVGMQTPGSSPELWVVAVCGFTIALGTYMGGWRVIRTLGKGLTEINTPQGFAAEASSATTILVSSHLGFALSTTQVCSGSIIGTGLGTKGNEVNWSVAKRMVIAWIVTFPAAGLIGAFTCLFTRFGTAGTIFIVLMGLVVGFIIFRLSRRNPVNAMNVNERADVKINAASDSGSHSDGPTSGSGSNPGSTSSPGSHSGGGSGNDFSTATAAA